ncbi:hypothetical protein [Halomonas aquatica]|uniref:Uncharacterized protein n=1 Tax=Halomonas aquatica TaxID=3151123 RepID=A0ABV1NI60_9GAMM
MSRSLKEQLISELRASGQYDVAEAVEEGKANSLPQLKKDVLMSAASKVKSGDGRVYYHHGMAGPSPSSGTGGIWSGGWGYPEADADDSGRGS